MVKTDEIETIPHGNETLLFVDDEKTITELSKEILEQLGFQVETRLNPMEALDLFQSNPDVFDLVITDMTMPQMTSLNLAEKVMEIRSDIPVIICTGYNALIDESKAAEIGIADYVMKPVSLLELAKIIRKVLDNVRGNIMHNVKWGRDR
ncbi:MAG: response regulator [Desulfobacteraceae bacterium]|nr:response regulator [Desulfobacteraceae bacterium]